MYSLIQTLYRYIDMRTKKCVLLTELNLYTSIGLVLLLNISFIIKNRIEMSHLCMIAIQLREG